MAVCKVDKAEAVALFSSLGLAKAAPKWTDEVLLAKIDGLAEIVRAVGKEGLPKKPDQMDLLRTLVKAKKDGDSFALAAPKKAGKPVPDEDDDEEEDDDAEGEGEEDEDEGDSDADDSDAADTDDDEDDGEDEDGDSDEDDDGDADDADDEEDDDDRGTDADSDDDDSDTEEGDDDMTTEAPVKTKAKVPAKKAPVPAKGKPAADPKGAKKAVPAQLTKKGGDGKPGIIASIVEFLQGAASEKAALSKKDILSKLTKRFPDTDADGMMKTINAQVPNRLIAQKGINVVKTDDKRFYVRAEAKPAKKTK